MADVLVDGVSQGAITSYQFNNVTADHTISTSFATNTYTITATAGANGSISPSGAVTMNYGSNQSFTITPEIGYYIVDVLVDGSSVGAMANYAFNNVTANHTISATFALTHTISGKVTLAGSGLGGVTVNLTGAVTVTTTTNETGDYSFTGLANGNYTVTPSSANDTFTPPYRNISVSGADINGQNFTATPIFLSFQIAVNYNTGEGPQSVTTGDFNCDGILDLAVGNTGSNNVSILLGAGDGTFQAAVNYGVGSSPRSVTTGDFNGDGKLDLTVANDGSNNVSILLGNGNGAFQGAVNYGVGSRPYRVAVGDFDGNGKLDLAVANFSSNNVSILLGNGDGTFQGAVDYSVGAGSYFVTTGDFNGDGQQDLAVANLYGNNVSILLGNGDGTFQLPVNYAVGNNPYAIAAGDFNRDSKLDLAVTNGSNDNVSILLGNGDGTFQLPVNYGAGDNPYSIAVADFNGDGKLDLAVGNTLNDNISILLGIGNGTFKPAVNYGAGPRPVIAVGDFDRDGKVDLAAANVQSNTVSILLNSSAFDPAGAFASEVNYGANSNSSFAITGDFNGDGKLDMAVTNYGSNDVSILLGNGDGTFQAPANYGVGTSPWSVTTGDFNGDGKLDLAVPTLIGNNIFILIGNGDGTFTGWGNYDVGASSFSITTGDFNRDGKLDLALANYSSNNVSILLGNGNGTFQTPATYGAGSNPIFVSVNDFNRDGKLDLAVANYSSNDVSILLGNGDGGFQMPVNYGVGANPWSVTTGDFNRDGKLDLAVATLYGNNISIRLGNGDGTFQNAVDYLAGNMPRSVTTGDFNRDGKLDLAVANYDSSDASILLGSGNGTFQAAANYGTGYSPFSVTTGDFNGDGKLDLVAANGSNTVSILLNTTTYTVTATTGANGAISPPGTVLVALGGNRSFIITPDTGCHVADVLVDGVSQGAITGYQFSNVTANHTISVSFAIDTYTITASAGANGSISPSGPVTVNHGSNQSFTITPNVGYHVVDVLVDGVSHGSISDYQFSNVIANHTISASFAINTYTITASAGANGIITPSGAVSINHGSSQAFTITPSIGYHVDDVLVDGSSVGAVTSHQFNNVTSNHTISASFVVTSGATIPTGTTDAGTGYAYPYSTSGSPGDGDPAEYQFDWKGDESDLSSWGSSTQTKSWSSAGTYMVRARARCALHTSIVSDWSSGLKVVVVDPNFVDFSINDGATHTRSPSVTLTYTTTGNPKYIRTSTGSSWTSWQDLSAITLPHSISLGTANGIREVFAQVKDDQGGISPVARASIILDTTAPKGVVKINGGKTTVANGGPGGTPVRLHLAMFDANMTGVQMRIKKDKSFVTPDDDDLWETFATGKDVTLTAGAGIRKVFVQFKDGAGKRSPVYSPEHQCGHYGKSSLAGCLSADRGQSAAVGWSRNNLFYRH